MKESELIRGNPLLNPTGSFAVKRRYGDDISILNLCVFFMVRYHTGSLPKIRNAI